MDIMGKWSVRLMCLFFIFLAKFFILIALGQRGGETFFSNLLLAIPGLLAAVSGVGAFFVGMVSIVNNKERSFLVFVSTGIGFLILLWCILEILFPH